MASRANTAEALAAEFLAQQRVFVADFPDAPARWSVEIKGEAVYNTASVVTIDITEFAYTGGAHPNTRRRLVSFDMDSGQLLGVDDLITPPQSDGRSAPTGVGKSRSDGPPTDPG